MSEKALFEKVSEPKALEAQKKAIEKQREILQEDTEKELQARGQEETEVGDWMVRFKVVISNKFNAKVFAVDHPKLYQEYMGIPYAHPREVQTSY